MLSTAAGRRQNDRMVFWCKSETKLKKYKKFLNEISATTITTSLVATLLLHLRGILLLLQLAHSTFARAQPTLTSCEVKLLRLKSTISLLLGKKCSKTSSPTSMMGRCGQVLTSNAACL